jgi:hypothetical protein
MKTFHRETIEQGTMLTPARIGFHKIMDRYVEDCPVGYVLAIRLPINRWKTWYCVETHQEKQGMAEYTAYFEKNSKSTTTATIDILAGQ